jgi:hypothetical protein
MINLQKSDGFKHQKIIVLPESALQDLVQHPLTQSMFVTDIGFFPTAQFIIGNGKVGVTLILSCFALGVKGGYPLKVSGRRLRKIILLSFPRILAILMGPMNRIPGVFTGFISKERVLLTSFQNTY